MWLLSHGVLLKDHYDIVEEYERPHFQKHIIARMVAPYLLSNEQNWRTKVLPFRQISTLAVLLGRDPESPPLLVFQDLNFRAGRGLDALFIENEGSILYEKLGHRARDL
nr:hypothetical protein [Tanacetum cinerariifolium]